MLNHNDSNYLLGLRFQNHHEMFSSLLDDHFKGGKYKGDIDDLLADIKLIGERLTVRYPSEAIDTSEYRLKRIREIAARVNRKKEFHNLADDNPIVIERHQAYMDGKFDHHEAIVALVEFYDDPNNWSIPDTSERSKAIKFTYTNYRGETAVRHAVVLGIRWGNTEWHPEYGFLMKAFDLDKFEVREFALKDCDFTSTGE